MTDIVEVPAAPIVPPFPAVGSNNYNDEAYAAGVALPGFSAGMRALAMATRTNSVAGHERALAAEQAKIVATEQADLAMGYRNTAGLHATTATDQASLATAKAGEAVASAVQASKLNLGNKSTPPTLDNQGDALTAGATYYDTTLDKLRVWTGSAWGDGISAISGVSSVNGHAGPVTGIATLAGLETLTNKTLSADTNNVEARSLKSATTTVSVSDAAAPTAGQVLMATSPTAAAWGTPVVSAIGDMITTAQTLAAPTWLPCNSSVYLQSSYPALFGVLGAVADGIYVTPATAHLAAPGSSGSYKSAYYNGKLVSVLDGGNIEYSINNGASWTGTTRYTAGSQSVNISVANGQFYVSPWGIEGSIISRSTNGSAWTDSYMPSNKVWKKVEYGNNVYVCLSNATGYAISSDGITWTARTAPVVFESVVFHAGLFRAAANATTLYTSSDGINWTANTVVNLQGSASLLGNSYLLNGRFYRWDSGQLQISADLVTWSRPELAAYTPTAPCIVGGAIYGSVYTSINGVLQGYVVRSYDGKNWDALPQGFSGTMPILTACGDFVVIHYASGTSTAVFRLSAYSYDKATQFITPQASDGSNPLKTYIKAT